VTEPEKYACEGVGPEYEAVGMLGMSNLVSDLKAVAKANDYCNRLGIDAVSAGATIGFAIECYERGLITKEDTNNMELRWGDGDLLIELVKQIGLKEGFGALFAEGTLEAAKKIGRRNSHAGQGFRFSLPRPSPFLEHGTKLCYMHSWGMSL